MVGIHYVLRECKIEPLLGTRVPVVYSLNPGECAFAARLESCEFIPVRDQVGKGGFAAVLRIREHLEESIGNTAKSCGVVLKTQG